MSAGSCGYSSSSRVDDIEELETALLECARTPGPHFMLVKASIAPVKGIPRVSYPPTDIRDRFKNSFQPKESMRC